jgi:hypothetical protein
VDVRIFAFDSNRASRILPPIFHESRPRAGISQSSDKLRNDAALDANPITSFVASSNCHFRPFSRVIPGKSTDSSKCSSYLETLPELDGAHFLLNARLPLLLRHWARRASVLRASPDGQRLQMTFRVSTGYSPLECWTSLEEKGNSKWKMMAIQPSVPVDSAHGRKRQRSLRPKSSTSR